MSDGPAAPLPEVVVPRTDKNLWLPYRAAETATEHQLVVLWEEHLMVTPIGVDDDFFDLGGHSLLAVNLLAAVEDTIGVRVKARTLYLQPTVAEMAAEIAGTATTRSSA